MSILSKDKRQIIIRRARNFWDEYRRSKAGIAGLVMLAFFLAIAFIGPSLAPYPEARPPVVASKFSMPEWASIAPQYADLPRTSTVSHLEARVVENSSSVSISFKEGSVDRMDIVYNAKGLSDIGTVQLSTSFGYQYRPPRDFGLRLEYTLQNVSKAICKIEMELADMNETKYEILDLSNAMNVSHGVATAHSASAILRTKLFGDIQKNPAEIIFSHKGNYTLNLKVTFQPLSVDSKGALSITGGGLTLYGELHGLLGTDAYGHDVFSQMLYGAYPSILVGMLTAVLTTSLSVVAGTIAGYFSGLVDEVIMRIVDIVLCIPFFVVLLTLSRNYRLSMVFVILVIAFFWWPGPSRTIRSKILALKESRFIEGARAAGGTRLYIIRRHLLPNILPLIMASLVLFVPGGILIEATLSFLGFGDPTVSTWGRMLSEARQTEAFASLAWWYIIPPGLAITFLCLSFVFIGHALDTIVNPRLRRRK